MFDNEIPMGARDWMIWIIMSNNQASPAPPIHEPYTDEFLDPYTDESLEPYTD